MSVENFVAISVVVPVYSGDQYLQELIRQLETIRNAWREEKAPMTISEVILVDDSAIDGSPALIDQLAGEHGWVTALHLMRNFGQHASTIAGILHSSGDWIVTMDEDLQHSPKDIEQLLRRAISSSADIVYANPRSAVHEAAVRDTASRLFKRMMVFLTGDSNVVFYNSFRLIRGALARAASSVCGHETYFDAALSWFTKRVESISLELKDQRFIASGRSGYDIWKLLSHARRLLVSSEVRVIRVAGLLGAVIVAVSMLGSIVVLIEKVTFSSNRFPTGWTSLMLAVLFLGGFITFMVSLALEYLSMLALTAHGKPVFFTVDRSVDEPLVRYFESSPR